MKLSIALIDVGKKEIKGKKKFRRINFRTYNIDVEIFFIKATVVHCRDKFRGEKR